MTSYVVAINHPSLVCLVQPFVEELRRESRRFGGADATNPKPFPSLVRSVVDPSRHRFGVMTAEGLVGMASLSAGGEISMAIAQPHRGAGHGTLLLASVIAVAERAEFASVTMTANQRSRPIERLGQRLGWTVVNAERGTVELVLDLPRRRVA